MKAKRKALEREAKYWFERFCEVDRARIEARDRLAETERHLAEAKGRPGKQAIPTVRCVQAVGRVSLPLRYRDTVELPPLAPAMDMAKLAVCGAREPAYPLNEIEQVREALEARGGETTLDAAVQWVGEAERLRAVLATTQEQRNAQEDRCNELTRQVDGYKKEIRALRAHGDSPLVQRAARMYLDRVRDSAPVVHDAALSFVADAMGFPEWEVEGAMREGSVPRRIGEARGDAAGPDRQPDLPDAVDAGVSLHTCTRIDESGGRGEAIVDAGPRYRVQEVFSEDGLLEGYEVWDRVECGRNNAWTQALFPRMSLDDCQRYAEDLCESLNGREGQ